MADRAKQTLPSGFIPAPKPSFSGPQSPASSWVPPPAYHYSSSSSHNQYHQPRACFSNSSLAKKPRHSNNDRRSSSWNRPQPFVHPPQAEQPTRYRCGPCQLTLDSDRALQSHLASHVTCQSCSFEAAPKVVKAHHAAVHGKFAGSGFKTVTVAVPGCPVQRFRICVGNRPEDVQQWIAERRKRFPRRKRQEEEEEEEPPTKAKLSSLLEGYGSSSSDEEDGSKANTAASTSATESNLDPKKPSEASEETTAASPPSMRQRRLCHFFARSGACRNGENCPFLHETPAIGHRESRSRPKRASLLEKLFKNDMKRENLLTLQLLEHIADSKFLQEPPERPKLD